jgi:hypothetical protein
MEGNNMQNDSSSFVYELFGPKETHYSSSSSGVLGSMSSQSPNVIFFYYYLYLHVFNFIYTCVYSM